MISLRKTVTELDRLEEFQRAALNCYSQALHCSGEYAVEMDPADVAKFRAQLETLRTQLEADTDVRRLASIESGFEAELKGYSEKTRAQIQRLRKDIEAATAAVESFAGSVNESEMQLESGLKRELLSLKKSASSDDVREMRGAIESSSAKIASCIEQMRASNQLAVAQLKDEIRLLHQEVRTARAQADPAIENHQVDRQIDELMRRNTPFSVLLVVVRNLEGLKNCFSPIVIASAVRNFQMRFEGILPKGAMVGRWGKDQFAAVLGTPPANAMDMSSDVVRKLSAPFLEEEKGVSQSVLFTPRAGVIEFRPGSDPAKFQGKLKQLAETLGQ